MAQSGSHPAPPPFGVLAIVLAFGSTHEQPLPSKRLFVSCPAAQNAREGLLQTFIQSYREQLQATGEWKSE